MPTYEYECRACGYCFEQFQNITENPLKRCPKCKKYQLHRLIGKGAGIIFKGTGFYHTDYRSDSYQKGLKAEKKASESAKSSKSKTTGNATAKVSSKDTAKKTADTAA